MSSQRFPVGAKVNFKSGTEMYGTVTKCYATACDVDVWNGVTGEYDRHHVPNYKLARDD